MAHTRRQLIGAVLLAGLLVLIAFRLPRRSGEPGAVRQAADAITNIRSTDADLVQQSSVVISLRETVRLNNVRITQGLSSQLDSIDSGFRLLQAEQDLVGLQADALTRRIQLIAALGGGFSPSTPLTSVPTAARAVVACGRNPARRCMSKPSSPDQAAIQAASPRPISTSCSKCRYPAGIGPSRVAPTSGYVSSVIPRACPTGPPPARSAQAGHRGDWLTTDRPLVFPGVA